MRTLKKVLALSLALAMIFSLTAVAVDYKDADKINGDLVSDVELLNALGIMTGDDGNFNPTNNITRAEAAKMMYVLKANKTDKPVSFIGTEKAKGLYDIKGHWAESFISYCAAMDIVSGQGAGKFNPNGNITGQELAKMLLVTVGYNPTNAEFTGTSWAINVIQRGTDAGLFNGYDLAYSGPATREYAAKLFSNSITDVAMVRYSKDIADFEELYVGKTENVQTLGNKVFNMDYVVGIATENNNLKVGAVKAKADTSSKIDTAGPDAVYGNDDDVTVEIKNTNINDNMLGQVVKVYVNTKTNKGYGAADAGVSKVYATTKDAVTLSNSSKSIELDGFSKADHSGKTINAYYYGASVKSAMVVDTKDLDDVFNYSTDKVRLVDITGDGFIDSVFVDETGFARVKAIDTTKGQFTLQDAANAIVTLKDADGTKLSFTSADKDVLTNHVVFTDTLANDDVVKVNATVKNGKMVYTIAKLTAVEGKFTSLNSAGSKATIGDTAYRLSAMAAKGAVLPVAGDLGKDFTFFTDGAYIVYAEGTGTTVTKLTKNLAYVIDAKAEANLSSDAMGNVVTGPKVEILKADGTRVAYEYKVPASAVGTAFPLTKDNEAAEVKAMKYNVVEYVMNGDKIYFKKEITKPANIIKKTTEDGKTLDITKKTFEGYLTNDDSYFFVRSEANAKGEAQYAVMKFSEFKKDIACGTAAGEYEAGKALYTTAVNGLPTVLFATVNLGESSLPSEVSTDYAFVTGGKYATLNDKNEVVYKIPAVNSKGEKLELVMADDTQVVASEKTYVVTTDNGLTTFATLAVSTGNWVKSSVEGYSAEGKLIKFDDVEGFFKITADTKIHYVGDDGGPVIVTDGSIVIAEDKALNAMYRLNTAGDEIKDLYVQVEGKALDINGKIS